MLDVSVEGEGEWGSGWGRRRRLRTLEVVDSEDGGEADAAVGGEAEEDAYVDEDAESDDASSHSREGVYPPAHAGTDAFHATSRLHNQHLVLMIQPKTCVSVTTD